MKAKLYIVVLAAAAVAGSCSTGGRITQSEYDDLYFLPSDRPVAVEKIASRNLPGNDQPDQYYDNIYSGDTLFAEQYNENVDFSNSSFYSKENSPFEYADDWSYSNRLRRFYGSSIYPYWRDPFYFSWSMYPWGFYDYLTPYWSGLYDPFYYGGFYGGYYGLYYGGYYSPFYSPFSYGYYSGYYWPTYNFNYRDNNYSSVEVGRRESYSTLSRSYSTLPAEARGRTSSVISSDGSRRNPVTSTPETVTSNVRRTETSISSSRVSGTTTVQDRRDASTPTRSTAASRPEYNQVSRSYTPTYNNPRLSERPSYNNTRISGENYQRSATGESRSTTISNMRSVQSDFNAAERRSSSYSTGQVRSYAPSTSGNYSAPVNSRSSSSNFNSASSSVRRESSSFSSSGSSGGSFGGGSGSGVSSSGSSGISSGSSGGGVTTGTRR